MSNHTNITDISNHQSLKQPEVTLDSAVKAMEHWRANKRNRLEPIPEPIWQQIFILLDRFSESTLRTALCISTDQFQRRLAERDKKISLSKPPSPAMDFCEATQIPSLPPSKSQLYKPAKIPATNTLVVEFCRADGQIMKIHTTTDSFSDLMKAFFVGG